MTKYQQAKMRKNERILRGELTTKEKIKKYNLNVYSVGVVPLWKVEGMSGSCRTRRDAVAWWEHTHGWGDEVFLSDPMTVKEAQ